MCHLDGGLVGFFFGCVPKDVKRQAGFLKPCFKTDSLFEGCTLHRQFKQGSEFENAVKFTNVPLFREVKAIHICISAGPSCPATSGGC